MHEVVNQATTFYIDAKSFLKDPELAKCIKNYIFQEEASILWQMRNVSEVVQLWGLYEGPNQSVLVTDDLIGGDLAERLCRPDFELNEGKCRRYIQQVCRQVQN